MWNIYWFLLQFLPILLQLVPTFTNFYLQFTTVNHKNNLPFTNLKLLE